MYVNFPMTLTISLRNPTRSVVHLKANLKNSEHFMFSGNTQVSRATAPFGTIIFKICILSYCQLNISIFALSTFDLSFNLYPLKAGWQNLPVFDVTYNTQYDGTTTTAAIVAKSPTTHWPSGVAGGITAQESQSVAAGPSERDKELQQLVNRWMPKKVFILVSRFFLFLNI